VAHYSALGRRASAMVGLASAMLSRSSAPLADFQAFGGKFQALASLYWWLWHGVASLTKRRRQDGA
jgi:hypothetical protein